MTENAELQAKIAALAGQINQHRHHQQHPFTPNPQYQQPHHVSAPHHHRARWSPYGRGGRAGLPQPHKNRSLVLSSTQNSPPPSTATRNLDSATLADTSMPADSFVLARGPGKKSLMNKNTYEREQKQVLKHKQTARAAKKQKIDHDERTALMRHVNTSSASGSRELVVDGIRFQLRDDGSKLMRIPDTVNTVKETRKHVNIAGVDFYRTKNGNLIRANAVQDLIRSSNHKSTSQCEHFTKHGKCPFGPSCRFAHDPDKVAICKTFLRTGSCAAGDSCDLSHVTSYHRVEACKHFLLGKCTHDACPYPHIRVSSSAPVCRSFAFLGFCSDGEDCTKRHVSECPDYSNSGFCAKRESGKCPLPHPDRASTLRKAAARQARTGSDQESDVSSEEGEQQDEMGIDDIDSDEAEDIIMVDDNYDHSLTQQQDYIAL